MEKKIKRYGIFVLMCMIFTMCGAQRKVYAESVETTGIKFEKTELTIEQGKYVFLYYELDLLFEPTNSWTSEIEWSSSDTSVATVSKQWRFGSDYGYYSEAICGINPGTCTITATLPNNVTAECKVTVVESDGIANEEELRRCLAFEGEAMEYKLSTDIVCEKNIRVSSNSDIALDLNGKV